MKKYYSEAKIASYDCDYNMILGQRSNGKSYAIKHRCIREAWGDNTKRFIVLRRQAEEIKPSLIEMYFGDVDIEKITDGQCNNIMVRSGEIWACHYDIVKDVNKKKKLLGYIRALFKSSQYKSGAYPDVYNIIYEEFICENDRGYLPREPQMLQSFVSTVARDRKIKVWLIGNTISRVCPYFTEWQLSNIPRQKQGTVECYEVHTGENDENDNEIVVTIAVELADKISGVGRMFFGASSDMINNGAWQISRQYPGLPKPRDECELVYTVVFAGKGFKFLMEFLDIDGQYCWYVSRKTTQIKPGTRLVSDSFHLDIMSTIGFHPLSDGERLMFSYLAEDKVVYCDSLTAEEFNQVRKELRA